MRQAEPHAWQWLGVNRHTHAVWLESGRMGPDVRPARPR